MIKIKTKEKTRYIHNESSDNELKVLKPLKDQYIENYSRLNCGELHRYAKVKKIQTHNYR